MQKPVIYFNDYVSLAVMALMIIALVTGQADARSEEKDRVATRPSNIDTLDNRVNLELRGYLGEKALEVGIEIVTDLSQFRGEDE